MIKLENNNLTNLSTTYWNYYNIAEAHIENFKNLKV